jgi:hypothetical protein
MKKRVTQRTQIRRLKKTVADQERELQSLRAFRNYCDSIVGCMADCVKSNSILSLSYWLGRSRELWK